MLGRKLTASQSRLCKVPTRTSSKYSYWDTNYHQPDVQSERRAPGMYFTDLTRNSFESGISATKWLALCKLLIDNKPAIQLESLDQVAVNISNSVLVLYRSYPGDPSLQDYLKAAIQDGLLPLSTFVSTLLQAARSTDLHIPATLDTLCRIALDAHYSSGKMPIGSVVSLNSSLTETVSTLRDSIALLRTAHSLPMSHFHQLTTSVSELVVLLMACISDPSDIPANQAMDLFQDGSFVSNACQLEPTVRGVLDTLVISLSLLIDNDKVSREAQLLHTTQLTMAKGDDLSPNSEADTITLGLLLDYMIINRAHEFGAGDSKNAVVLLISAFRWSSWTLVTFYTQLLLSSFSSISQSGSSSNLWKPFLVGRLPVLLSSFATEIVKVEGNANIDPNDALLPGLLVLFQRRDIVTPNTQSIPKDIASETPEDNSTRSFSREFLQQLIKYNLLTQQDAVQLDPMVSNEHPSKWHIEAHDLGLDVATYLESKLLQDNGSDNESQNWVDKLVKDAATHSTFSSHVLMRFESSGSSLDVDTLGQLCKLLHTHENILDIVALHVPISDLVFYSAVLLEDYDCETVGDPQTAVSHLGNVVLFIQFTSTRYKFENRDMTKEHRTVSLGYLLHDWTTRLADRTPEELKALYSWYNNLFSKDSEGIEDNMLRSTKPKILLQITPALFTNVSTAWHSKKLENEVVMNGISYFNGPLLNWTLVGTIKALVKEIQFRGFMPSPHYDIIQALVLSPACPKCVLVICSPYISILLQDKKRQTPVPPSFNVTAIRATLVNALGLTSGSELQMSSLTVGAFWYSQVQQTLQKALFMARTHKIPSLDIRRCVKMAPPIKFLQLLWTELILAANQGEIEACRRIATFVLTSPQGSTVPPLLPIFLHIVLPSLIASADLQQPPEQAITVDLMVAIIPSVLNAATQLEVSLITVFGSTEDHLVLGESSAAMARRLAIDLRRSGSSHVSRVILQRLSSSPTFVGNFSVFKTEGT